jgi:hypothetical protein
MTEEEKNELKRDLDAVKAFITKYMDQLSSWYMYFKNENNELVRICSGMNAEDILFLESQVVSIKHQFLAKNLSVANYVGKSVGKAQNMNYTEDNEDLSDELEDNQNPIKKEPKKPQIH